MTAVTFIQDPPTLTVDFTEPPTRGVQLTVFPDRPGWDWRLTVPIMLNVALDRRPILVELRFSGGTMAGRATLEFTDEAHGVVYTSLTGVGPLAVKPLRATANPGKRPAAETVTHPTDWGYYRVKQPVVDAIQWTGSNQAEILDRVGDDVFVPLDEPCGDDPDATASIRHPIHGDWRPVHTGDWIVRQADGSVHYEDDETFRSTYEAING